MHQLRLTARHEQHRPPLLQRRHEAAPRHLPSRGPGRIHAGRRKGIGFVDSRLQQCTPLWSDITAVPFVHLETRQQQRW